MIIPLGLLKVTILCFLQVSPLQYDGAFREETFEMDYLNDASETRDMGSTSSTTNLQNNSMTGAANESYESRHKDVCNVSEIHFTVLFLYHWTTR